MMEGIIALRITVTTVTENCVWLRSPRSLPNVAVIVPIVNPVENSIVEKLGPPVSIFC
jgi:hypothetical protein